MMLSDLLSKLEVLRAECGDLPIYGQNVHTLYQVGFKGSHLSINLRQYLKKEVRAVVLEILPARKDDVLTEAGLPSVSELVRSNSGFQSRNTDVPPASKLERMTTAQLYNLTCHGSLSSIEKAEFVRRWGESWRFSAEYQEALAKIPEDEWMAIQKSRS